MPRRYRKRRDSSAEEEEEPDHSEDRAKDKDDEVRLASRIYCF